jgi:hypothetical protein
MQSFPKIGKFRANKAIPLFDALGELYDGQLAEGTSTSRLLNQHEHKWSSILMSIL